ncbi:Hypothetical predicted protein [Paramuricea clavata]|uniref:Uncharacterized protein n=1 Tax=Paramuricea clavata TaxID=317549 RepID=A0A7D9E4G8_PARCT|nr:Hypothetical predicted protein [Paramuricea clavata]
MKTSRDLFARLLILSKTREINLKELLSYSLSDYPLSLATVNGGLVKTAKAKMFEILEECLYITSKCKCHLLTTGSSPNDCVLHHEVPELQCDHEEADTRLLLHSNHAAKTHDTIIVKIPDTDVFLLCIAMWRTIGKKFHVMVGTGNIFRIIDTSAISDVLGQELCSCLLGFHAVSGCDSTSVFCGKGKAKPWKIFQDNTDFVQSFCDLGKSSTLSQDLVMSLNVFVCLLYGDNECRYSLFKAEMFR